MFAMLVTGVMGCMAVAAACAAGLCFIRHGEYQTRAVRMVHEAVTRNAEVTLVMSPEATRDIQLRSFISRLGE